MYCTCTPVPSFPYQSAPAAILTTEILESWPTQASLSPEGEKETSWTHPPGVGITFKIK